MSFTSSILSAACALRAGRTVIYPTETVLGLGGLPNPEVLARIVQIKDRNQLKGLILIAAERRLLEPFMAPLDEILWRRILQPHRRATTWIVPAASNAPALLTGRRGTVAVRITRHIGSAALSRICNSSLVSTSANISGQPATQDYCKLSPRLVRRTDLVLCGKCGKNRSASTIRDIFSGKMLVNRIR